MIGLTLVLAALALATLSLVVGLIQHRMCGTRCGDFNHLGWGRPRVGGVATNGDVPVVEVCCCGATRPPGSGWRSWRPLLHRMNRPYKSLNY